MKKAVTQILNSIKTEPHLWSPRKGYSKWNIIGKDRVIIKGIGNTKSLSVLDVIIDGHGFDISWWERYQLEKALVNFLNNCDLSLMDTSV